MLETGNTGLQQATSGNPAISGSMRGCWRDWQHWATAGNCWQLSNTYTRACYRSRLWQHWATAGNCWQFSNIYESMLETLATLGYSRQLLATQQHLYERMHAGDSGNTGLQQATAGNSATSTRACWRLWQHWATAGNCWQLSNIYTRMHAGDSGNTGLQQATAGNSATSTRACWRLWQHWATAGNCWQPSNIYERMLETLATLGYSG